jgi:hypothetical protein
LGLELELVVLGGQLTGGQLEPLAVADKSAREDAEGVLRKQPDTSLWVGSVTVQKEPEASDLTAATAR